MGDLQRLLNESSCPISEAKVSPQSLAELIGTITDGTISHNIAQAVFPKMWERGLSAQEIIAAENLALISDSSEISKLVDEAIAANPRAVEDYRGGKEKALGAIVGHVMRQTKGQANPAMVNELVVARLKS